MADDAKAAAAPATENQAAEGEASAVDAGAKKKRLLMIGSAILAVVGIVIAVGVVFFLGGENKKDTEELNKSAHIPAVAIYDVPEFTLNLLADETGGVARFMKMKLALEFENAADISAMNKLLPRLQDDWGGFLRQMRASDMQGSAALQQLRESLLRRATQTLDPIPLRAVYIREMLVQ